MPNCSSSAASTCTTAMEVELGQAAEQRRRAGRARRPRFPSCRLRIRTARTPSSVWFVAGIARNYSGSSRYTNTFHPRRSSARTGRCAGRSGIFRKSRSKLRGRRPSLPWRRGSSRPLQSIGVEHIHVATARPCDEHSCRPVKIETRRIGRSISLSPVVIAAGPPAWPGRSSGHMSAWGSLGPLPIRTSASALRVDRRQSRARARRLRPSRAPAIVARRIPQ